MIDQIAICLFGATAIWLSQDKRPERQRFACIFGMAAQPFWYYAAWKAEQWGIFIVCAPYTVAWARGVYNHWILPRRSRV